MRRTLMAAVAVAMMVVPAAVWAQQPESGHGMRRHDPIARMIEKRAELGLTDDQVARLEQIRTQLEERNRPLREQLREARPERPAREGADAARWREARERWRAMPPEEREQARAEARVRMEQRRAEMRARMEQMTPEEREAHRAEMRRKMEERRAAARERMEALRPTLDQLRQNQRKAMDAVREVLTDEQEAKLRELHKERRGDRGKRGERRPRGGAGNQR